MEDHADAHQKAQDDYLHPHPGPVRRSLFHYCLGLGSGTSARFRQVFLCVQLLVIQAPRAPVERTSDEQHKAPEPTRRRPAEQQTGEPWSFLAAPSMSHASIARLSSSLGPPGLQGQNNRPLLCGETQEHSALSLRPVTSSGLAVIIIIIIITN